MPATVLRERYQLPAARTSRSIGLSYVSTGKHAARPAPLFAEHGHALAPAGGATKNLGHLHGVAAPPQDPPATREATT
jgi:hypothetical protein